MRSALIRGARLARLALLATLRATGVFRLVASSRWRQSRLLVLCYHGVALDNEHLWDPELFVTQDFLRRRFEILRDKGYSVLPLDEALARCRAGTLPPRSVALTFDDGLSDFFQLAAPLLAEFDFPATVYVTTYYSEKQWPVTPPIFNYLLWKGRRKLAAFQWLEAGISSGGVGNDAHRRRQILTQLLAYADRQNMSGLERWQVTQQLARKLDIDLEATQRKRILQIMTADEISAVAKSGVDVQLHTHRHRVPRDRAGFEQEISENRERLSRLTGRVPEHFCYPSGVVFEACLPWLDELGVKSATTCDPGMVAADTDSRLIPRYVDTTLQTDLMFEAWASGTASLLRRKAASPLTVEM